MLRRLAIYPFPVEAIALAEHRSPERLAADERLIRNYRMWPKQKQHKLLARLLAENFRFDLENEAALMKWLPDAILWGRN